MNFEEVEYNNDSVNSPQEFRKTTEQWISEGDVHYRSGWYQAALDAYEQALRLTPNHTYAQQGKSHAYAQVKQYKEATTSHGHTAQPSHLVQEYYTSGNTFYRLGNYEEAIIAFQQATACAPSFAPAYQGLGNTLYRLKKYQEALNVFDQAIRINPNYPEAQYSRGVVLSTLKLYEEAAISFDRMLQIAPSDAGAYYNKGIALYGLKRYEDALSAFEQAIRFAPNNALTYHNKAKALYGLKR